MGKTITAGFISDTINGIGINSSIKCNNDNLNNNTSRSVAYVVMHYTGNSKDTAKANANYFGGAGRNASAHFFVDDAEIYQSVELRDTAWHCGAKSYKHGSCRNANSIGIEMCCTAGNYRISDRTKENAAYLCAFLCKMLGIGAGGVDSYVLRHYDVTGKNCPAQMVSNPTEWQEFKNKVKGILGGSVSAGGQRHTAQPTTDNVVSKGDIVTFTGGGVYISSTAEYAAKEKDVVSTCKVTAVNEKGTHKYHCISQDGKGVCGWVNAESIKELSSKAHSDPASVSKGDIVTFTGGGVYKSSTAEYASVQKNVTSTCKVTAVNTKGTHPYHCISQDGKGVYGWVNAADVK